MLNERSQATEGGAELPSLNLGELDCARNYQLSERKIVTQVVLVFDRILEGCWRKHPSKVTMVVHALRHFPSS